LAVIPTKDTTSVVTSSTGASVRPTVTVPVSELLEPPPQAVRHAARRAKRRGLLDRIISGLPILPI
jgi:predicted transcriptional regulator of viral defense system